MVCLLRCFMRIFSRKITGWNRPSGVFIFEEFATGEFLHQFLQLRHHRINFCLGIVLAETETNGNLVGIVIDSTYDMTALVGAAGAGAAAAGADIIDVEIEEDHLRFFCFGETGTQHSV